MIAIALENRDNTAPEQEPRGRGAVVAMNLEASLDLGNITFFQFRGRAYGVPPLPWHEGEKILRAWSRAEAYGAELSNDDLPGYFNCIKEMQDLIWHNIRPAGNKPMALVRRFLKFIRVLRNPYRLATEREVAERALFLSGRRMSTSEPAPQRAMRNVG